MRTPLTSQLLGDLIEKGYNYMLVNTGINQLTADTVDITLTPVKQKPDLDKLPPNFETFYHITREPMQLACGVDGANVYIEYHTFDHSITEADIFNDTYFRMSEEFFRQVLDSLEDYAVITTNKNGDINSWNTGAQKLLGYTEPEVLGLNARIFFTDEDIAEGKPDLELKKALSEGRAVDERYHVRKNKSRFWGSGLVFPLLDEGNNHRGFTKIMRNQREEEQAKAEGM
ncbi:PAS domain S-box-containing protein [Mucilaginibacter oryzae]|uniref:PAS domain S-box-containing protein n=1 Tax=Mucilaginibacter oryzae TaxID=468058 RepID=A0A316HQ46_9SPHI|nr:PAS domain S-box protein [Mucilaginibacter oryzae]PWK80355.1 PAS domain S-box-containing protein [Mucilaginibacter oryzae]